MNNVILQPRNFCELGALHSVLGINKAIPIVHSGSGCCLRLYQGISFCNGYQGMMYGGGSFVPNDNIHREDFIYGGENRIRKLIQSTISIVEADLYVVLTGCNVQLAGDNTKAVVNEFKLKGVPIVYVDTAGFKGSAYSGHELVINSIIEQFVIKKLTVKKRQINLWTSPPYLDPFWSGNIETLKNMLEQIGFSINVLFGLSSSVNCWSEIPSAEFNILISAWTGLKTMELLKKHFGTPYFHYPIFPIGAHECSEFLREVANFCKLDMNLVNQFIEKKESMFYYYMERLTEMLTCYDSTFPQRFFTIGESTYVSGITRFLVKELSMIPGCQYIVDNPPYKYRNEIENSCKSLPSEISLPVTFINDGEEIIKSIKEKTEDLIPLIIGSSWDSIIASKLKGYFISMSPPISDRLILNKSYVGYEGGLAFIEDIFSCILRGL